MKDFSLSAVRALCDKGQDFPDTGDEFLDVRYVEQIALVGHIQPYYRLFHELAWMLRPAFSVELGSWQATAAAHLAGGNSDGHVVTIDIHKDGDELAIQKTLEAAAHYPNLDYINAWTWDAFDRIEAYGKPIDLLFIDSWHRYDMATKDWIVYSKLLGNPALVICDDIVEQEGTIEGMIRFWEELPGEKFLHGWPHMGVPMGFLKFMR